MRTDIRTRTHAYPRRVFACASRLGAHVPVVLLECCYVSLRLKDKNQLNAELTVVARSPFLENISPSLRIDFHSSPIVLSFATDIRRLV